MSKTQIADRAKISRTTLDNALAGADIKVSTIESLSKVLGVNSTVFFEKETSSGIEILEELKKYQTNHVNGHSSSDKDKAGIKEKTISNRFVNLTVEGGALPRPSRKLTPYVEFTIQIEHLKEEMSHLEALLSEKERLIVVLMQQVDLLTGKREGLSKKQNKKLDLVVADFPPMQSHE